MGTKLLEVGDVPMTVLAVTTTDNELARPAVQS